MRLRVPRSALVGLGLIALGASSYSGIERWTSTRIVRPVHMPISLAAGHIRTGSFRLNLKTNYWVVVNPGEWWKADSAMRFVCSAADAMGTLPGRQGGRQAG